MFAEVCVFVRGCYQCQIMLQACPFQILSHMKQYFLSFQNAVNRDCHKAMPQILRYFLTFKFQIILKFLFTCKVDIKYKYKKQKAHAGYAIFLGR